MTERERYRSQRIRDSINRHRSTTKSQSSSRDLYSGGKSLWKYDNEFGYTSSRNQNNRSLNHQTFRAQTQGTLEEKSKIKFKTRINRSFGKSTELLNSKNRMILNEDSLKPLDKILSHKDIITMKQNPLKYLYSKLPTSSNIQVIKSTKSRVNKVSLKEPLSKFS